MLIQFIHSLFWVQKNSTQGAGQFLSILRANGELVGIIVDADDGSDVHEVARLETDDPADVSGLPAPPCVIFPWVPSYGFLRQSLPSQLEAQFFHQASRVERTTRRSA